MSLVMKIIETSKCVEPPPYVRVVIICFVGQRRVPGPDARHLSCFVGESGTSSCRFGAKGYLTFYDT